MMMMMFGNVCSYLVTSKHHADGKVYRKTDSRSDPSIKSQKSVLLIYPFGARCNRHLCWSCRVLDLRLHLQQQKMSNHDG